MVSLSYFDEPAKEANLLSKLGEFERKGFPEETQELAKCFSMNLMLLY